MPDTPYSYQFYSTTSKAWDAMYETLATAQRSIYWEVFIFVDDKVGDRFIEILCKKAKAGVEVKMVIDAIGGYSFSDEAADKLRRAGVDMLFFNRLHPEWRIGRWISRLWYRNHRKVLIVDDDTVFLGGVNVKADYQTWDDIYLKIVGLVPRPLLRGFAKSYISSGGSKQSVRHLLRLKRFKDWRDIKEQLRFIAHSPRFARDKLSRKMYLQALSLAKKQINLLTPYYVPDKAFLRAITAAEKRGVSVNIFTPLKTDIKLMGLIARAYFTRTLKAGANVYLLPTMNHGKAITIDGTLGMVGSINVTPRSFFSNEESGVSFNDVKMVKELNAIFEKYVEVAQKLDHEKHAKRSRWMRLKEWLALWLEKYV